MPGATPWPDDMLVKLGELIAVGASNSQIGRELTALFNRCITRNAVAGQVFRSRLVKPARQPAPLGRRKHRRTRPQGQRKPRTTWKPKPAPWSPPTAPAHQEPPLQAPEPPWEPSSPVTLSQLTADTCRYPMWPDQQPGDPFPTHRCSAARCRWLASRIALGTSARRSSPGARRTASASGT